MTGTSAASTTAVPIERLANGGDGVGRLADGRAVFVPRTAPGDIVQLGQLRSYARFARARVATLIQPGPGRVEPACRHYLADDCGGCQLQHLDVTTQLNAKRAMVADALARIGGLAVEVPPVIAAEEEWGYRSRVTLAVAPGRRHAGFHPLDQPSRVFPLTRCQIAAPALMTLWEALRTELHLLPPDATQLLLRLDREGRCHAVVRARGEQAWGKASTLRGRLAAAGVQAIIWWQPGDGAPRVVAGDQDAFPATVFEQVNPAMGDRVREFALAGLGHLHDVHVWDLYAGIGETTDRLFAAGATVESVESDRRAVEFAERRWRLALHEPEVSQRPEPAGIIRHVGKVEEVVAHLRDPGAVIANPPRAGLARPVTESLRQRHPSRIAYISCDPATLARDLSRLCGAAESPGAGGAQYRLTAIQPFDLFPQTAHVETVALLETA